MRPSKRKLAVQQASIGSSASKTKACKAVQMYTLTSLDDIKQVDLREELAAHGEVTYGEKKLLKARLNAHYKSCIHLHKPGGAASDGAATFYNTAYPEKTKDKLSNACLENFFSRVPAKKL